MIEVDGQPIVGYRDNSYMITAGEHDININLSEITNFSTALLQPQILSFTGNIEDTEYDMNKIRFNYSCPIKALVSLNSKPTKIMVDSKEYSFNVLKGNDCFSVFLPTGNHTVKITTGDKFSYGLNMTSLWSISAIGIYGFLALLSLIVMFLALKIFRKKLEN